MSYAKCEKYILDQKIRMLVMIYVTEDIQISSLNVN